MAESSGIAKDRPGWACAHPTHTNCKFGMPCDWDKKINRYSNKTVKHCIKTVNSSIVPTQLIQPGYATG